MHTTVEKKCLVRECCMLPARHPSTELSTSLHAAYPQALNNVSVRGVGTILWLRPGQEGWLLAGSPLSLCASLSAYASRSLSFCAVPVPAACHCSSDEKGTQAPRRPNSLASPASPHLLHLCPLPQHSLQPQPSQAGPGTCAHMQQAWNVRSTSHGTYGKGRKEKCGKTTGGLI